MIELNPNDSMNHEARRMLTEVAKSYGCRFERVMFHIFERHCGCYALEWLKKAKDPLGPLKGGIREDSLIKI